MSTSLSFTFHSLDRYKERSGSKASYESIINKLEGFLVNKIKLSRTLYYARGWVFVIVKNTVQTVYKPINKDIQLKINKKMNLQSVLVGE